MLPYLYSTNVLAYDFNSTELYALMCGYLASGAQGRCSRFKLYHDTLKIRQETAQLNCLNTQVSLKNVWL